MINLNNVNNVNNKESAQLFGKRADHIFETYEANGVLDFILNLSEKEKEYLHKFDVLPLSVSYMRHALEPSLEVLRELKRVDPLFHKIPYSEDCVVAHYHRLEETHDTAGFLQELVMEDPGAVSCADNEIPLIRSVINKNQKLFTQTILHCCYEKGEDDMIVGIIEDHLIKDYRRGNYTETIKLVMGWYIHTLERFPEIYHSPENQTVDDHPGHPDPEDHLAKLREGYTNLLLDDIADNDNPEE